MAYSNQAKKKITLLDFDTTTYRIAHMIRELLWTEVDPTKENPVVRILIENPQEFLRQGNARFGRSFNMTSVSRCATLFQMMLYDATNGPDGDGKPKSLRRHWYHWFKTDFAQRFQNALSDYEWDVNGVVAKPMKNRDWEQRQSAVYAELVDVYDLTYLDLWIKDASRMMTAIYDKLFPELNIVLAVEKNSLFEDFISPARAAGIPLVLSGAGKNGKAATELYLRQHFNWPGTYDENGDFNETFTKENPLIFVVVSDHDYDGEEVINDTFENQARRYTPHVITVRIGIKPEQVTITGGNLADAVYEVKLNNTAYEKWALEKGIFITDCDYCGHQNITHGDPARHLCESCSYALNPADLQQDTAYGLEVEAIRTRDYFPLVAQAILQALPFELIVAKLRENTRPDTYTAANTLTNAVIEDTEQLKTLNAELEKLKLLEEGYRQTARHIIETYAQKHIDDFYDEGDDPTPEQFINHVASAGSYPSPWRPFSASRRTTLLIELLQNKYPEIETMLRAPIRTNVAIYDRWDRTWEDFEAFLILNIPPGNEPEEGDVAYYSQSGWIRQATYNAESNRWQTLA